MPERTRLLSIDVLRGIAFLAVLAIHTPHDGPGGWCEQPFFLFSRLAKFGYLGVERRFFNGRWPWPRPIFVFASEP